MRKEVKIALVAIVGLIVIFFGMNFLKGLSMFSNSDVYYISYHNVSGCEKNTPVYADGVKIGTVTDINYDYTHQKPTIVTISVDKQMRIPAGTTAQVTSDLMKNTQIVLLLANNPRQRIMPGETIKGYETVDLMDKVATMVPAIEKMLPKVDSILSSVNAILANPAIQATLANAQTITGNLTQTTQQLNVLMAQLNQGVPTLMGKADRVLDNTNTFTGNLAAVDIQGTVLQVNKTLASVQETLNGVQQTVSKLNSSEGTVGKLLTDPSVFNNLNSTISHADSLVIDLKAHPKRYVHFSIW